MDATAPARRRNRAPRPEDPLAPKNQDAVKEVTEAAKPEQPPAPKSPPEKIMERPPLRTDMRVDPRAEAFARAAEILGHIGAMDEGTDDFYIDPKLIPDGWSYEWKRHTVYGMQDPAYEVALARTGWQPVPASRHPEMMPAGWSQNVITRKGQMLMERPMQITKLVQDRDNRAARDQVRVKEEQLSSAPAPGQMPRAKDAGGDQRTAATIKKSYEAMPVPSDNK